MDISTRFLLHSKHFKNTYKNRKQPYCQCKKKPNKQIKQGQNTESAFERQITQRINVDWDGCRPW